MAVWSAVNYAECLQRGRMDAEYYQPTYRRQQLELERLLKQGRATRLGEVADVEYGYMPMQDYVGEEDGEPLLRVTNIHSHLEVDDSDLKYVPLGLKIPSKKRLRTGDVLLVQCGDTTGKVGLINERQHGMLFPSFCLAVRSKGKIPSHILGIFLFSEIGQRQLAQSMTISTVRPNTTKPDVERLIVPNTIFDTNIAKGVSTALARREESRNLYARAERLLLEELGLGELDLSPTLFYERSYSEARAAARLDAEFFQPKYYRLQKKIRACAYPNVDLGSLILPIKNGLDCREFSEEGIPYIRVGDVRRGRIDLENANRVSISWDQVRKDIGVRPGDVLLTRKGSYGNVAFVREGEDHCLISSEIMLLRLKDKAILPEYLMAYLNSPVGFNQVERFVHGVAFYSISQPDLAKIKIIRAPNSIQKQIRDLIHKSYDAHDESRGSLEEAKRMVEEAVLGGKGC